MRNNKGIKFALFLIAIFTAQAACLTSPALPTPSSGAATLLALTTTPGSVLPAPTIRPTITRTATIPADSQPQPTATSPGDLMPALSSVVLATPLAQPGTPMPRPGRLVEQESLDELAPLMVFGGGSVLEIQFSWDGSLMGVETSASRLIFDAGTLEQVPYDDALWEAAFEPLPGDLAAVQLSDGVYLEQAVDGELVGRLEGAERLPEAISPSQTLAAIYLNPQQIGVWETASGELLRTLDTRQAETNQQCEDLMDPVFSPDDRYLTAGCRQRGTAYLWRIDDAVLVQVLETPGLDVEASQLGGLAFSRDSRLLSGVLPANQVAIWRVRDGALQHILQQASGSRQTLVGQSVFSPDGYSLIGGFVNGELLAWRVSDGELLRVLQGPGYFAATPGEGLAISPDGRYLVYASWNQVLVRSSEDGQILHTIKSQIDDPPGVARGLITGFVRSLATSSDSRTLAVIMDDGSQAVALYQLADGNLENTVLLPEPPLMLRSAQFEDLFVIGTEKNVYMMRSNGLPLEMEVMAPESDADRLLCLAISPDGKTVAASRQYSGLQVWDWQAQQMVTDLGLHPDCGLQFSPGGSLLAASAAGELVVYDTQDWQVVRQESGLGPRMSFAPPGDLLLAVNTVSQLQAVDLREPASSWPGLSSPAVLSSLVFHPTGRWFAAAYLDGAIRIFGPM